MKLYKKILLAAATVIVSASMFAEEKIPVQQPVKTQDAANAPLPYSILPPHAAWELAFHDEFDGNTVNWDVWKSENGKRRERTGRYPENNVVKDGFLYQYTRKLQPPRDGMDWSCASIETRDYTQTYGYFECRMKYNPYHNNAFWLFRPKGKFPQPPWCEVDINEGHTPNELRLTLCWFTWPMGDKEPQEVLMSHAKKYIPGAELDKEFHVYGCEWNEKEFVYYFDGQPMRRVVNPGYNAPMDIRISTLIWGLEKFEKDGRDKNIDGSAMVVDWVRTWRKTRALKESAGNALPLENFKITTDSKPVLAPPSVPVKALAESNFGNDGKMPAGWFVGEGKPAVKDNRLALAADDYVYWLFPREVGTRLELTFEMRQEPCPDSGLLISTLGEFDQNDPAKVRKSYYEPDVGLYLWFAQRFVRYYRDKGFIYSGPVLPKNEWQTYRLVIDFPQQVFELYGASPERFVGSGEFRNPQKKARGLAFKNRKIEFEALATGKETPVELRNLKASVRE
jgi:beta-glucanase (GH16 family)